MKRLYDAVNVILSLQVSHPTLQVLHARILALVFILKNRITSILENGAWLDFWASLLELTLNYVTWFSS